MASELWTHEILLVVFLFGRLTGLGGRHSMPEFLLNPAAGDIFAKFVIERQDTDKMEAFRLAS